MQTQEALTQLRELDATSLIEFERICLVLAVRPYPRPDSSSIREIESGGRALYTYFDPNLPFQVDYMIYEPDAGSGGLVVVTRLAAKDE